jgi:predicted nucleic acid-binding protein
VRIFLGTNVLVSAFASRGIGAVLFELVLLEHELIVGRNLLRELGKVLREKIKLPGARAAELIDFVAGEAAIVVEKAEPVAAKVDADDALVLGEASLGRADMFVTGDAALARRGTVHGLRIVSPRQFWEALHGKPR